MQTFQHTLTSFLFRLPQVVLFLRWAPDAFSAVPRPSVAMQRRVLEFIHHTPAFPVRQFEGCIVSLRPLLRLHEMFRKPRINIAVSTIKMAVKQELLQLLSSAFPTSLRSLAYAALPRGPCSRSLSPTSPNQVHIWNPFTFLGDVFATQLNTYVHLSELTQI